MAARPLILGRIAARRLSDERVADRALGGDPVAFGEVYRRYHSRIYGYCLARLMEPEAAADAAQEVFMRLLHAEPGTIERLRAWLFAVARNVTVDAVRRRIRAPETPTDDVALEFDSPTAADTADEVLSRDVARRVFLALRRIRPRYRTALILREMHGQTSAEIAEALGTTVGATDTLVSRARDAFGAAYAEVSGLPSECRVAVELIYRSLGSGVSDHETVRLDAHLEDCARCRTEAGRARRPQSLGALLPLLLPAPSAGESLLARAAAVGVPERLLWSMPALGDSAERITPALKVAAGVLAASVLCAPAATKAAAPSLVMRPTAVAVAAETAPVKHAVPSKKASGGGGPVKARAADKAPGRKAAAAPKPNKERVRANTAASPQRVQRGQSSKERGSSPTPHATKKRGVKSAQVHSAKASKAKAASAARSRRARGRRR